MSSLRADRPFSLTRVSINYAFLGVAGFIVYVRELTGNTRLSVVFIVCGLLSSMALLCSAIGFLKTPSRGWWLAWLAMVLLGSTGLLSTPAESAYSAPFWRGFMLSASGLVVGSPLANPRLYRRCFDDQLPHAFFGAMPTLQIAIGTLILVSTLTASGVYVGTGIFIASLAFCRWLGGPLLALLHGHRQWHVM